MGVLTETKVGEEKLGTIKIKDAKLSDILESYPEDKLCRFALKNREGRMCAVGLALDMTGEVDWDWYMKKIDGMGGDWDEVFEWRRQVKSLLSQYWGLDAEQENELIHIFDEYGRDDAVSLLRSWGK